MDKYTGIRVPKKIELWLCENYNKGSEWRNSDNPEEKPSWWWKWEGTAYAMSQLHRATCSELNDPNSKPWTKRELIRDMLYGLFIWPIHYRWMFRNKNRSLKQYIACRIKAYKLK
jgi:hypothetical protein